MLWQYWTKFQKMYSGTLHIENIITLALINEFMCLLFENNEFFIFCYNYLLVNGIVFSCYILMENKDWLFKLFEKSISQEIYKVARKKSE